MAAPTKPTINEQPLSEDQQLSFDWESQGAVDNYYIYDSPATLLATIPGNESITTVSGLTNGQTYNAYIVASNVNGVSDPAYFRPFQPGLPPLAAPLTATATRFGENGALIEWTPSGESLVAPIQWYVVEAVSADPAASNFRYTADGLKPETSLAVTGLNHYTYQFTVQGVNCPGYSPPMYTSTIALECGSWTVPNSGLQKDLSTVESPFGYLPGNDAFTVEGFIYLTYIDGNSYIEWVFGDSTTSANGPGIKLFQANNIGAKRFELPGVFLEYASYLTTSNWYHFAISRNASSDIALWINGTRETLSFMSANLNTRLNATRFLAVVPNTAGGYLTNLNFVQGAAKYDPANTTIPVPTFPVSSNANTVALYLATDSATAFNDSGPNNYTTDTTNANGIVWDSNNPF